MKLILFILMLIFASIGYGQTDTPTVKPRSGESLRDLVERYDADLVETAKLNVLLPNSVLTESHLIRLAKKVSKCELPLDQSPNIRGIKLGLTLKDYHQMIEPARLKQVIALDTASRLSFKPEKDMSGISRIKTKFQDNKLTSFAVFYESPNIWDGTDEFAVNLIDLLGMPIESLGYNSFGRKMECPDFTIIMPQPGVVQITNTADIKVMRDRKDAERQKAKESFKP